VKVAVFGATGRTGRLIVREALARGIEVSALARSPEKLDDLAAMGLSIVGGDACDAEAVSSTLEGTDAALSALGATSRDDPSELSETTRVLVGAMETNGPKRIVAVLSAMALMKKVKPEWEAIAGEHRCNLEGLRGSGLEWIAVCPSGLTDDPATGSIQAAVGKRAPEWTISREDLARFVLDQADSDAFLRQAVGISN
jgi:putative NADH-flavin reductase